MAPTASQIRLLLVEDVAQLAQVRRDVTRMAKVLTAPAVAVLAAPGRW